jgi:uncharacterized membrane protein YedE/YeeE
MKYIKFLLAGVLFGIVMTKSEALSWYRIIEMFRFESFHMYGIIGVAVIGGAILVYLLKKSKFKNIQHEQIPFNPKDMSIPRYLLGGIVFGLGWAMTGACPGPMFTLLGHGYLVLLVIIVSAILGTYVYGVLRSKLPH